MSKFLEKIKFDYILLICVAFLLIFGILILASVSASLSQEIYGTTYYYLNHQILLGILPGIILGFLAFRVNLNLLKKWAPILFFGNVLLLAAVFLPKVGISAGGATRWLNFFGFFSFQPSEFLKLNFVLYLASWLDTRIQLNKMKSDTTPRNIGQTFLAFLAILAVLGALLLLQPDASTLGIILLTALIMYFMANTPFWQILSLIALGAGALAALIPLAPYRFKRILVFFKPETDPLGLGYQIKQALIAVGSGGIAGVGLGMSHQRFGFLPASMSDSIFAVLAEETGFIGCFLLVLLFLTFLWRGFKIGKSSPDKFSQLAAFGITSWIVLQAVINISAMTGLFPLTGIPLPFFSYGGTAICAELIGVGILLNISKSTKHEK